jgi:hypothetical protein
VILAKASALSRRAKLVFTRSTAPGDDALYGEIPINIL